MSSIQTELPRIIRIAKWLAWGSVLAFLVKLSSLTFLAPSSVVGNILSLDPIILFCFFLYVRRRIMVNWLLILVIVYSFANILMSLLPLGSMGFYSPTSIIIINIVQYSLIATAYGLLLTREAGSFFTKKKS
ncbi:hypothetical protein PCS_01863 [Desulfocurvibacter africanus PCS]|uniref:Uncharacterized protein n=1 Tax=Desulfocurvibacter africanus PCS TaxID=1262666 RepID=M5Q184_DESAF|nr:hypothetical protein [Desulfocurvibacter africanus]EMG37351.1 hypothetical protein PCS_01863 [Desulfocurvibacter africanus PCS]